MLPTIIGVINSTPYLAEGNENHSRNDLFFGRPTGNFSCVAPFCNEFDRESTTNNQRDMWNGFDQLYDVEQYASLHSKSIEKNSEKYKYLLNKNFEKKGKKLPKA